MPAENVGEALEQEEKLADKMKTVRGFTYLSNRASAGGECESAVTAKTECGWANLWNVASYCI